MTQFSDVLSDMYVGLFEKQQQLANRAFSIGVIISYYVIWGNFVGISSFVCML